MTQRDIRRVERDGLASLLAFALSEAPGEPPAPSGEPRPDGDDADDQAEADDAFVNGGEIGGGGRV